MQQKDRIRWSFSKLSTANQCKMQYKLAYEDVVEQVSNNYGAYGSLMHDSIEMILRGEDGLSNYLAGMDGLELPISSKEHDYHTAVPTFLKSFSASKIQGEILNIEKKREFDIDENNYFIGLSDLDIRLASGGLAIIDWKISKKFSGKTLKEKARQLYLYARFIKDEFGEFPEKMFFFFPTDSSKKPYCEIKFNLGDYNEAQDWMMGIINDIRGSEEREATPSFFFCKNLCGVRLHCSHGN